jgi:hypothetical protein
MTRARGSAREHALAVLITGLACYCCAGVASAVRDLDERTAVRQRQLRMLAPATGAGMPGPVPALDGLFPGLQVVREWGDQGFRLRLLPSRSGEGT